MIGDCIARVLEANGWDVRREFYYNDAGVQIHNLAMSVQARAQGKTPDDAGWPADGYRGDYIVDVANAYLRGDTVEVEGHTVVGARDAEDLDAIRAIRRRLSAPRAERRPRRVRRAFDVYFLESSLYADGKVEETVRELIAHGHTYEEGGALWLRTTDFGDDKDRVMRKSDGTYTYFVPDVAYHRQQMAARLPARDHRTRRRPPRLAGAREGRPAGARCAASRRATRNTCCTRWSR